MLNIPTLSGEGKLVQLPMGNSMDGSQKTKIKLLYDPVIFYLGIYADKLIIQ